MAEHDFVGSKDHDLIKAASNALWALRNRSMEIDGREWDVCYAARNSLADVENHLRRLYKRDVLPASGSDPKADAAKFEEKNN